MLNTNPFRSFSSFLFYAGVITAVTVGCLKLPDTLLLNEAPIAVVIPAPIHPVLPAPSRSQLLAEAIAGKYSVSEGIALRAVLSAQKAEKDLKIPYYITLGMVAVESSFKERAINSHDHGLMQVNSYYHRELIEKMGGLPKMLNVETNIQTGTKIFSDYVVIAKGDAYKALRIYNGRFKQNNYPDKVLKESAWIKSIT